MRKDCMMTLVRARPCNSLQAPWGVNTVENFVPAAKRKPLVKLADSAMRFTPKESASPSAFTVAERNVCALIRSENSDGSSRDQRPGGPAKLRRCVDSWVALGQAFAKAGKTPADARTVRTAVGAKMMVL